MIISMKQIGSICLREMAMEIKLNLPGLLWQVQRTQEIRHLSEFAYEDESRRDRELKIGIRCSPCFMMENK